MSYKVSHTKHLTQEATKLVVLSSIIFLKKLHQAILDGPWSYSFAKVWAWAWAWAWLLGPKVSPGLGHSIFYYNVVPRPNATLPKQIA